MKGSNHGVCTWIRWIRSNVAVGNPIRIGDRIGVLVRVAGWDRCQGAPGFVRVLRVVEHTRPVDEGYVRKSKQPPGQNISIPPGD